MMCDTHVCHWGEERGRDERKGRKKREGVRGKWEKDGGRVFFYLML